MLPIQKSNLPIIHQSKVILTTLFFWRLLHVEHDHKLWQYQTLKWKESIELKQYLERQKMMCERELELERERYIEIDY